MKKSTDKKELVQKFRTEAILDAAMKVIAQRGLDKATMEQVASEAGISKATIYLYFKNKEALYFHCVIHRLDDVMARMREAVVGVTDPVERVRTIIITQVGEIDTNRDFFRVFLSERMGVFLDQSTEFGQEFIKRHREYASLLSDALEDAMDAGAIRRMDPTRLFYLLFAMVRGMAMFMLLCEEQGPLAAEAGLILDVFFNGVKVEGPVK